MSGKPPVFELMERLQLQLLRSGGRLPSLDVPQKARRIGDNSIEGKAYVQPKPSEGETNMATRIEEEVGGGKKAKEEVVTPAGGASDSEVANAVAKVFQRFSEFAGEVKPKTYGRRFAEEAIPAATTAFAVVAVYAGLMLINNRWGRGSIEREKLRILEEQGIPPQMG